MLPINITDFRVLMENNCYYIDKTLLVKELMDKAGCDVALITRPRRFGKSLNLSMLDYYFNINKSSNDLFKDKKRYHPDQSSDIF